MNKLAKEIVEGEIKTSDSLIDRAGISTEALVFYRLSVALLRIIALYVDYRTIMH